MNNKNQIQVTLNQEDWLESNIQCVNILNRDGLIIKPCYTSLKGSELPDNLKPIFQGIIDSFKTLGNPDGTNPQWLASIVVCERIPEIKRTQINIIYKINPDSGEIELDDKGHPIIESETTEVIIEQANGVLFKTKIDLPSGSSNNLEIINNDVNVITLYDTLTSVSFWIKGDS